MKDLSIMLGNTRLKNPIISGGGPVAGSVENIKRCADAGFGAVVTKTTSWFHEFHRYPRPRYYVFDHQTTAREPHTGRAEEYSWIHLDHNSQYPPDKFIEIVRQSAEYCEKKDCLLIGSFAGAGVDQWEETAVKYAEAGAKALELNFCCPNPEAMGEVAKKGENKIGSAFADNVELAIEVIQRVKKHVNIPLYPKMPPTARKQISALTKKYIEAGADGISFYANSMALKIDIETAEPLGFGSGIGASHGHMMDALSDVAKVAKEVPGAQIMAGRGVRFWSDIIEFLMAGAAGVQISAAIMMNGLRYVNELLVDIERWMERKNYSSISELQGIALPKIYRQAEIKEKVKPLCAEVNGKKCVACGRCEEVCWYDAAHLHVKSGKGAAKVDPGKCVGCTLCAQVCPTAAISMHERTEQEYLRALVSEHPELVPDIT